MQFQASDVDTVEDSVPDDTAWDKDSDSAQSLWTFAEHRVTLRYKVDLLPREVLP